MIKIPIKQDDITWAKANIKTFDEQKTYDKFGCSNNFIGLLGELVFDRWLTEQGISHEWVEFTKKGWDTPDFRINGQDLDLKTTFSCQLWFQKPKFDYYLMARVNEDLKELILVGFIKGTKLQSLLDKKEIEEVIREGRVDYVCPIEYLTTLFESQQLGKI